MRKRQVKTETSLDKIQDRKVLGRSKSTESPARGRAKDAGDVTLVPLKSKFSGGQQRSGIHTRSKASKELTVPSRPFVPRTMNGKVSLHGYLTGKRMTQNAMALELEFLGHNSWRREAANSSAS